MNEMKIFTNEEFGEVRTVEIESEPYFVGKDVADILGYQNGSRDINRHVEEEDREKIMFFDGNQDKETIVINESGLYSLILSSKLPNAKRFKRWVTSEVLPSIRRHGMYAMDELIENPDLAINALTALKEERAKRKALELENQVKDQQIAELQPKASYYDLVLQCKDLLSMTEIAKDYGMSAKKMNKLLHELGVQFNQSGVWFLYAKYQDKGYTQTKTQNYNKPDGTQGAKTHMYWTQKGRLFLYELLKQNGILPMIERDDAA
ncbi:phage antirepressor KilAC domain-containing protein [Oribacterium sp. oral taxon 102]|uniref:phage antirepressor n=1 Tax=Oribacterium sp. oral taxon 102 TaxID=671214 RepID=UPI0015B9EBC7|nr:phage antirepressor KilAC domain-containing protein [Oribacterium sp. oral taxon 102]NWO21383.1 phage antirepressor KilAC domain-containing protein [Oribacterium sp. oral taxon 102]